MTIHNDAWAYCDGSDSDDEHVWESTGGAPLEQLVRWSGAISKFRAAQRTA